MSKFFSYKQAKIHYTDEGSGKVLVFLHGFLESVSMWKRLATQLVENYRVICIDLPGHGQSECLGYVHKMEEMAEVVKALMDKLDIDKFILTGHSMGGYVSLAYAEKYGDSLRGLCLMNSTAEADSEEKKINRDRAIRAVKHNKNNFIRLSIPNLFRDENQPQFKEDIRTLIEEAMKMDARGIIAALEGMKVRENKEDVLKAFGTSCMMIIGKHDPVLDYSSLLKQVDRTGIQTGILEDGHMSHIEEYEEFSYLFMHFIENI